MSEKAEGKEKASGAGEEHQGADLLLSLADTASAPRAKPEDSSGLMPGSVVMKFPPAMPPVPSIAMLEMGVGNAATTTTTSSSHHKQAPPGKSLSDTEQGVKHRQPATSPIKLSSDKSKDQTAMDGYLPSHSYPPPPPPSWMTWQSPARMSPHFFGGFGPPHPSDAPSGTGSAKRSADSPAGKSPPKQKRKANDAADTAKNAESSDQIIISPSSSNEAGPKADDDDEQQDGKQSILYAPPPPYYMIAQGYETYMPRPPFGYPYPPYPAYYTAHPPAGSPTSEYPPTATTAKYAPSSAPAPDYNASTAAGAKVKGAALNTSLAPGAQRCVPLDDPMPIKQFRDWNTYREVKIPDFHRLVNFPDYISKGRHGVDRSVPAGKKRCVMCGNLRVCSGASRAARDESDADSLHIIPRQNKGVCTACDVAVWVVLEVKDLEIKWCKGCKNFRHWPAFGEKGLATKCVRCRDRQKEKYAAQRDEKRHFVGKKDDDIAARGLTQLRAL